MGYSGTIVHAVLCNSTGHAVSCFAKAALPLSHRRRALYWVTADDASNATRTQMYTASWAVQSLGPVPTMLPSLLLSAGFTKGVVNQPLLQGSYMPSHSHSQEGSNTPRENVSPSHEAITKATSPSHQAVALMLLHNDSASPSLYGVYLMVTLAQQLAGSIPATRVLVYTCGPIGKDASFSGAAHGGVWGLGRVVRLEHASLETQTNSLSIGTPAALPALMTPSAEGEVAWNGKERCVARLRVCHSASKYRAILASGLYAITGGLGGLGLSAASLLVESGASGALLASRSGRIARDGQGLAAQLKSMRDSVTVVACDGADFEDTIALIFANPLTGVFHAAGASDKGLLIEVAKQSLHWMYAPKANGIWHLHAASATAPREARVLWSSIGSGLGNTGQASYAAGNACLDAHASILREHGIATCSLQWPLVGGAGMGAAGLAARRGKKVAMAGMAEISLANYATLLGAQLTLGIGTAMGVQMAHLSDLRGLLQDLGNAAQPRFGELQKLSAKIKYAVTGRSCWPPANGAVSLEGVIAMVKSTAGAMVDADAPLLDAGIDSLGEIELRNQLQSTADVELPSALLETYPTARQLAEAVISAPKTESAPPEVTSAIALALGTTEVSDGSPMVSKPSDGAGPAVEGQAVEARAVRTRKHRVLMLHGRAADGAVMERLLIALKWTSLPLDFVTVTALHPCKPIKDLYPDAIKFANGTFDWGLLMEDGPRRDACVQQSVEDIETIIAKDPIGFHGIGGICDGSLIASLVAARQPANSRLNFYINMCGGPWIMLPDHLRTENTVKLPSIHLIGKKDETFTWDQLRGIPEKCQNPLIVFHGAGHSVPLVTASIAHGVEATLCQAEVLAATKAARTASSPADGDEQRGGDDDGGDGGGRLNAVAEGAARLAGAGDDELEYDSLALLAPKEPEKKPYLAHLTGIRGLFIGLVVCMHFVPRPTENHGSLDFVDKVDIARGWFIQDLPNKIMDRVSAFGMPFLFVVSGFGIHLTYRKKTYELFDFYIDRLARLILMLWLCIAIEMFFDRMPARLQPYFQPGRQTYYTYFFNAGTLSIGRPIIIQIHNLLYWPNGVWPTDYISPTVSQRVNEWIGENLGYCPTILHLWFLQYTVICTLMYPVVARMVVVVDRLTGALGLALFVVLSTLIAIVPMLIDQGQVHLSFNGSTWGGGPIYNGHRQDDFWTDEPWHWTHYTWSGETWSGEEGRRLIATRWRKNPQLRLPWFLDEPSVFWPIGYILWFTCGIATVHFMTRMEDWRKAVDAEEVHAEKVAEQQETDNNDRAMDIESGVATSRTSDWMSKARPSKLMISLGKAFTSHEGRGWIADLCVLSILLPCLILPFNYNQATNGYFNKYGWNEFCNWNKAYIPVTCLFLYGSASKGCAGYFSEYVFASDILVSLGDISLAVYALQAIVARLCGVRWFLRGPNQESYCKDLEEYYAGMPGGLAGDFDDPKLVAARHLLDLQINTIRGEQNACLNATADQIVLLMIVLGIVSCFVTYKVEPFLDQTFRAAIGTISTFVLKVRRQGVLSRLRLLRGRLGKESIAQDDGERQGLLG